MDGERTPETYDEQLSIDRDIEERDNDTRAHGE